MAALAAQVAARLPGAVVRGTTLAAPGALAAALGGLAAPLVYPFFMANGWFVGTRLPGRLAEAGRPDAHVLPPFGVDPGLPVLVLGAALAGARAAGITPSEATLLLAAHGSRASHGSARDTAAIALEVRAAGRFGAVETGFIEETELLEDAARRIDGPALCLPLFALSAGHVAEDVPAALERAGFRGPLLPPIGASPQVPAMIAAACQRAMEPVS